MTIVARPQSFRPQLVLRALACAIATLVLLSGCLLSDTSVVSVEFATTPLLPGLYVGWDRPTAPAEKLRNDHDVRLDGTAYSFREEPPKQPNGRYLTGYMVRIAETSNVYLLQIPPEQFQISAASNSRWILIIGVVVDRAFCLRTLENIPSDIADTTLGNVRPHIRSNTHFLQWLRDHVDEISAMKNTACLVRSG